MDPIIVVQRIHAPAGRQGHSSSLDLATQPHFSSRASCRPRRYWVTVMVPRKLGKRDGGWIEQW